MTINTLANKTSLISYDEGDRFGSPSLFFALYRMRFNSCLSCSPNGKYNQERKYLADKINSPYAVDGHGRDANIYKYEPSIKYSEVDKLFFALQDQYRDFQAELNSMKYKIENEVLKENNKRILEYERLYEEYTNSSEAIRTKYNHYITQLVHEISEYKIVIPNDLQSTYEEVKKLGK